MKLKKSAASMALLMVAGTPLAHGQTDDAQSIDGVLQLEEIIVTAQRREQSLQDVGVSVTAFTSEDLERSNITEAKDYLLSTPNVSFSEDGQTGNRSINISIRGVGNVALGESSVANSIGYYMDDFNIGAVSNGTVNPPLIDVERIEVLRGPQGTYFGRNTSGGAINITTKKPSEEAYTEFGADYSSFNDAGDTQGVYGVLNTPLSDRFFLRTVLSYETSSGLVENVNPNGTKDSGYDLSHARIAGRWLASDATTVDLSLTVMDEENGFDAGIGSGVLDLDTRGIFGDGFVPIDDQLGFYATNKNKVNHNTPEKNDNQFTVLNARVKYEADGYTFKSITGLITSETQRVFDQDNISADAIIRHNDYEADSFSQEVRWEFTRDNSEWVVGALYAKDEQEQFNSITAGTQGSYTNPVTGEEIGLLPPIPAGFRINENNLSFETESLALFADYTWHVSDRLSLSVGGRYSRDEISNRSFGVVAFEGSIPDIAASETFSDFSPKLSFDYDINDDVRAYGVVSQGYKAGGVQLNGNIAEGQRFRVVPFDEEKVTNVEFGIKSYFSNRRVQLNASVFSVSGDDLQAEANFLADPNDISSATTITNNASDASIKGAELEFAILASEHLTLSGGLGVLDSEFDSFTNAQVVTRALDLSNQALPGAPELTANLAAQYDFENG
jgi:iron complex outermembrane receptor protein